MASGRFTDATIDAPAEFQREILALSVAQLDRMLEAIWPMVLAGNMQAVITADKIIGRRSNLCGLGYPTTFHHHHHVQQHESSIDRIERALAQFTPKDPAARAEQLRRELRAIEDQNGHAGTPVIQRVTIDQDPDHRD